MSYCRFSDESDVYLFSHVDGYISCCACRLAWNEELQWYDDIDLLRYSTALAHIQAHRDAGHLVPRSVEKYLRQDWKRARTDLLPAAHPTT